MRAVVVIGVGAQIRAHPRKICPTGDKPFIWALQADGHADGQEDEGGWTGVTLCPFAHFGSEELDSMYAFVFDVRLNACGGH